jgi:hypothetical protein
VVLLDDADCLHPGIHDPPYRRRLPDSSAQSAHAAHYGSPQLRSPHQRTTEGRPGHRELLPLPLTPPLASSRWPAKRGRRTPIGRAKCTIEPTDAAKTSGKCDLRERPSRLLDQPFCRLNAPRRGDLARSGACVLKKEPPQMPRADPEVIREIADRRFVEKASLDQPHAPRDGGSRAVPCRAPRRCFGPAAQTWSKARPFGGGGGRKKLDVLGFRGPHTADRTAVDASCAHAGEKHPIECPVASHARAITSLPVETEGKHHLHPCDHKRWR